MGSKASGNRLFFRKLGVIEHFAVTVGFLVLSLVITNSLPAFILMLVLFLWLKVWGIAWRSIFVFLRIPLAFAFFGLLGIVLVMSVSHADTLWVISRKYVPLSITVESLEKAKIVLWRSLNSLLSLYILIATTSSQEKKALADKLHIPSGIIELGILSFRYIQLLDKKKQQIVTAQRLRLGYVSYTKAFRSSVLLLSTVFIYSLSAFRLNHQALLARGYTGTLHYSSADLLPKDRWWFVALVFVSVVSLLVCYQMC